MSCQSHEEVQHKEGRGADLERRKSKTRPWTILINLVYFEPETTKVMFQRHIVERRLGTGHEVGQLKPKDPEKASDPELKALSKKFGMLHGFSASMNLVALGVGCYWLNYCTQLMLQQQSSAST